MAIASAHAPVRIFSRLSYSPSPPTRTPNTEHLLFRRTTHLRTQNRRSPRQKAKHRPSDTFQPLLSSVSRLLDRIRGDDINLEILGIAVPAMLALAADPIALLVDTAFVGHLGSAELAAIGVSVSVFNLVSKLFNIPLLNVTTSFVAAQQALEPRPGDKDFAGGIESLQLEPNGEVDGESRKSLPSVSTSLALAAAVGILESIGLIFGLRTLMDFMGIAVDSPMRLPAEQFLTLRAFGAPAIVLTLAAQGTFRGFKDTKTPLYAVCAGNLLNAILDPILIFLLGLGIGGAAIATVTSEYLIAGILLWKLNEKVILSANINGEGMSQYLKSVGLLVGRTIAVLITMTISTSLAAQEGPVPMAGHQICLQVWLAVSLLNDALALAGQALLASEYTVKNYKQARIIVYRVLQIGTTTGIALSVLLFFGFEPFSTLFTTDFAVLQIARSGVLFVTISQPINALAFVIDGLYYGVSDFSYAAYSMVFIGLISSAFLLVVSPVFGLAGVWAGLVLFMSLRAIAGIWRLQTRGGPWKILWSDTEIGSIKES
ncbi:protein DETOXIFICATION 44, chloroplastic-like isoform X1 [Zingiber officinale]|uniref:protein DETOXIFICATION 44, chloroplastic-like isoform X1 n=2 Tax=Zingiber officinale TaxID=94328 RepID=UPI001C4AECFE|nr:protein DETOXIFICATION 44, chloroplastic-like isoform X1 [Zingiber officinale]